MSASISFPMLTDSVYLFRNLAEANAFFQAVNIASATTAIEGTVKQCVAVAYASFGAYADSTQIDFTYDGVNYVAPTKVAHDETRAKLLALQNSFNDLLTKLKTAGILHS